MDQLPPIPPANEFWTPRRFLLVLAAVVLAAFPKVALGLTTFFFHDYGALGYPGAVFFQQSILSRRTAAVESLQPLRRAVSRANGFVVSIQLVVRAAAAAVVVEFFRAGASHSWRCGNVCARPALERGWFRRELRWFRLRVQRRGAFLFSMGQLRRLARLAAVGGAGRDRSVAQRWSLARHRRRRECVASADGHAGTDPARLAVSRRAVADGMARRQNQILDFRAPRDRRHPARGRPHDDPDAAVFRSPGAFAARHQLRPDALGHAGLGLGESPRAALPRLSRRRAIGSSKARIS